MSFTQKISLVTYIMLKKNPTLLYVREKISNSRDLRKKILTQTKSPIPPSPTKVTWSTGVTKQSNEVTSNE